MEKKKENKRNNNIHSIISPEELWMPKRNNNPLISVSFKINAEQYFKFFLVYFILFYF